MFRKAVCTLAVLAIGLGTLMAEEFVGSIRKIEDGKITFTKFKKGEKKKGEETTLPVADNVKVVNAKFNKESKKIEVGDPLPDGLKNERFQKIGERGMFAQIVTDEDGKKITEIRVFTFGGKKKKDQ